MSDFRHTMGFLATILVGCLLAGIYFGGLWWTVRCLPDARRPWLWYFGSLLVRLALVLSGFWIVIAHGDWPLLAACFLGFVGLRTVLVHFLGYSATNSSPVEKWPDGRRSNLNRPMGVLAMGGMAGLQVECDHRVHLVLSWRYCYSSPGW